MQFDMRKMGNKEISNGYRSQLENDFDEFSNDLTTNNDKKRSDYKIRNAVKMGGFAAALGAAGGAIGGPPGALFGGLLGGMIGGLFT